jgi:2-amino-4-hydroxy-6-hydroxymethyldihydropteridine diphosphokinase
LGRVEAFAASADVSVLACSRTYGPTPVGGPQQPKYLNAVLIIRPDLEPDALLDLAHRIEQDWGRQRRERWGPRTLDVDLIDVDGLMLDGERLTLPHPRAHERAFVLVPWEQVDPDAVLTARRARSGNCSLTWIARECRTPVSDCSTMSQANSDEPDEGARPADPGGRGRRSRMGDPAGDHRPIRTGAACAVARQPLTMWVLAVAVGIWALLSRPGFAAQAWVTPHAWAGRGAYGSPGDGCFAHGCPGGWLLPRRGPRRLPGTIHPAGSDALWAAAATTLGSLALVGAALWLEWMCRLPSDGPDAQGPQTRPQPRSEPDGLGARMGLMDSGPG